MIHENIKTIESTLKMPIMSLPVKMTLIHLTDGIVMISPLPEIERFKDEIDRFGKITDIVAPNLFHNLGLKKAMELYPAARLWGAKGFKEKIPDLNWHNEISPENWIYQEKLSVLQIEGTPKTNEIVFIHRESHTLIATDLCFNILNGHGLGHWLIFKMTGTYKRFGVSRFFLSLVKERQIFAESIQRLLSENFDNIILAHGENIVGNGNTRLQEAMRERKVIPSSQRT